MTSLTEAVGSKGGELSEKHRAMAEVIVQTIGSLQAPDPNELQGWERYAEAVRVAHGEALELLVEEGYRHVLWMRDERAQADRVPTESFPPEHLVILRGGEDLSRRASA